MAPRSLHLSILFFYFILFQVCTLTYGKQISPERFDIQSIEELKTNLSITAILEKPILSPGDKVVIKLFFNGYGNVDEHKFIGYIPPDIIEGKVNIKLLRFASSTKWKGVKAVFPPEEYSYGVPFFAKFGKLYFEYADPLYTGDPINRLNSESPINFEGKSYAPIWLSFKLSDGAPPGEHEMQFKLIYVSGNDVSTAESKIKIKVLSFAERYRYVITAFLTVLTFFLGVIVNKKELPFRKFMLLVGFIFVAVLLFLLFK